MPQPDAIPALDQIQLDGPLAEALAPRVARLGYLGEFFQRTAHQPDALLAFHRFTEAAKSAAGDHLTELVALTVSTATGNTYERHQHEQLSVRQGRSRTWIAEIERLEPDADLATGDRDAQLTVLALLRDRGHGARARVDEFARTYGAPAAVALLFLVGRYLAHAVIANALELQPPVPSIFAEAADAC